MCLQLSNFLTFGRLRSGCFGSQEVSQEELEEGVA